MNKFLVFVMLIFCQNCAEFTAQKSNEVNKNTQIENNSNSVVKDSEKLDWIDSFDLDGDGKSDEINFDFSRGAHCCYYPIITLTRTNSSTKYPFSMDGGYVIRVDNSYPDKFDIWDIDNDNLPEILMRIETYNYDFYLIPKKWTKRYGFKTNYIVIEAEKGKLQVCDQKTEEIYRRKNVRKILKTLNKI